ncbi:hypothetical protein [Streptomyces aurantiogriseus]|uniref:Uncharacterized protein n=1 Tax=Streptomyces aurantiogriseus TaxID=66870 RepID=A0A918L012_9ACTN|nr:hypothetical protein [Streptomyces aurantiogriseus]GGR61048.1 hypothetical protein GCM10010251_92170 [Streptomyces aurantiogriseus]
MSARDELLREMVHNHLYMTDERATELLDAYRAEVLAKAIGRLRAVPVQCTALTGPVWYGTGWNDAITTLEEIADYQTPDDEAYPGELQMLRALALGIRVAARKADMDEVQRLALDHAARDGDARDRVKTEGRGSVSALDAHVAEVRRADAARLLAERAQFASRAIFCDGVTHAANRLTQWADEEAAR